MQMIAVASIDVPRPREVVFDVAVDPEKLSRILKKKGPIPGVISVAVEGSGPVRAGSRRKVKMSDGGVMGEEISVLDRPGAYRYHWLNPPPAPFNLLVKSGNSDFKFTDSNGGTRIDWVYTFELTTPLVYVLAWPVIRWFRSWMAAGLSRLEQEAAGAAP